MAQVKIAATNTMEYIMAPMKGSISSRILFGHLLGLGFCHSSKGSRFGLRSRLPFEIHLLVGVKKFGCKARLGT